MTRIGFAYNQKPDDSTEFEGQLDVPEESNAGSLDEEPLSYARAAGARTGGGGGGGGTTVSIERTPSVRQADDAFAEWDSPDTIAAVEHALSGLGEVVRL